MPDPRDMVVRPHGPEQHISPYAAAAAQASALPSETPEKSLLRPILRQWWLVLLFILIGAGIAREYLVRAQPLYSSYSKIYIQPTARAVVEALGSVERDSYLSTQVEFIRSTKILDRVASVPGLRGMKTFLRANGNPVLYLQDQLDIQLERKTDLIVVSLNSPWPDEAAAIVSAVVDAYQQYCMEERDDQNNQFLKALEKKKDEQDAQITSLNAELHDFYVRNPNISPQAGAVTNDSQSLSKISASLMDAQMHLIEVRSSYASGHPTVKKYESLVAEYQRMYDDACEKVTRLNDKTSQVTELKAKVEQATQFEQIIAARIHEVQLATSGRKLIDIDVIEPARISNTPSYPRKNRAMAIAIVSGMLLGAGLALLRDRLDGRMRSVEEIQTIMGLPILGVVPAMTGRRTAVARAMTVHLDPRSPVAEAYRTVRTAVYFGAAADRCKTILVTSPEPGDGKTTSASNLAIAIAQTGRSVLLLDADFRKPTQHKNLDIKDAVGLSSVIAGRETLEQAIQHTGVVGLDILPCGPIPANPSEILNSREFGVLVDALAAKYDHIIFDSPPINVVTDARILGAVCDSTILVVRADKSTRKSGEHARNALMAVGARVLGAIVNDAPNRKGFEVYGGSYYGTPEGGARSLPAV